MRNACLWFRRNIPWGCIAGVCLLLATPASAIAPTSGPHLVCHEPVFQFGTASNQTAIMHTFQLCNEGSTTAHITRVAASCGCVVPELDRKEIPPGAQTSLRATFSLAGRQGHQRRVIRVLADDAVTPCLELWMEGDIARFPFDPETINFGTVLPSDASARTAHLVGLPASNRIIRAVADNTNFFAAVAEDGHGVVVHARPPLPDGMSRVLVQAFTDNTNAPVENVPVTAMVVPLVRVMPATITLPRDTRYATRIVWIRPGRAGTFAIREVRCPVETLTPMLTNIGAGIYRLDLKNIPVSDALQGQSITLITSLSDLPTIEIPFVFDAPAR